MKSVLIAAGGLIVGVLIALFYDAVVLDPSRIRCDLPKNHCIRVTIGTDRVVQVDNWKLHKHGPGHSIYWIIDNDPPQNYRFPDGGVAFNSNDDGTSVFTCDIHPLSAVAYFCRDTSGKKGDYKYAITVAGSPTPHSNSLAPWASND